MLCWRWDAVRLISSMFDQETKHSYRKLWINSCEAIEVMHVTFLERGFAWLCVSVLVEVNILDCDLLPPQRAIAVLAGGGSQSCIPVRDVRGRHQLCTHQGGQAGTRALGSDASRLWSFCPL